MRRDIIQVDEKHGYYVESWGHNRVRYVPTYRRSPGNLWRRYTDAKYHNGFHYCVSEVAVRNFISGKRSKFEM